MPGEMKEKFKMVIREFHEMQFPDLVEREGLFDYSILDSRLSKVITIIGPRRAGKTFLLYQIIRELLKKKSKITDIVYINFEDERIMPLASENLQDMLDAYFELEGSKAKPYIFLDEIQNVSGWDRFVRRLNDRGFRTFITGSNSRMLAREIATSLRGRTLTFEVFPFSFREFVEVRGVKLGRDFAYTKTRHRIGQLYDEYFFSGGYPEITLTEDKNLKGRILQDYFNTIFYRDLVERYAIKNTELLKQWLNLLIMNHATLISFSKVENDFKSRGMKLSRATLSYFARYVEDTFFGFFVEMYSESARKRQVNPKKFYLVDVGMHNYLTFKFAENRGRTLENLVFLKLRRRSSSIFYYKTGRGQEIDFLVKGGNKWNLIQVCYDIRQIDVFTREKRALIAGLEELGIDSGTIINESEKRTDVVGDYSLEIVPAWEWLLASGK